MAPVNNLISDTFLREKYDITEQYSKDYPEDPAIALSLARSAKEAFQEGDELIQNLEEHSNGMTRLRESSEVIHTRLDNIIELSQNNTQALQEVTKSLAEIKAITSNIANIVSICVNQIFEPVQSGMNLLDGPREPVAVLPRENQLAIEANPESTISDTDPTNQPPVDEKKARKFRQVLCSCWRIISFACERAKNLVIFIGEGISYLISKINLWRGSK